MREDIFPTLHVTQGELAHKLKVSRSTTAEILHERRPITPDMAIRIGMLTNTTPRSWLNMQQTLGIWQLQQTHAKTYAEIERIAASI